jgi:exodeoxyribonuclease I
MAEFTYFWHDYETFGRVPRRDRPAQFAGIRTDAQLQEIGPPVMFHCQPAPDYLPDPESCLLTGILPQDCLAHGLPEHAFARAIEAQLGQPGTIGLGYNTIRFDDEVTRHLFWRNLIDPYAREWQNGCGRWDLVDLVRCAWALRPDGIVWPRHPDGRPSFKLEHLTAANGIAHEAAHDALSDVRATLALARLIRDRQPRLFDFCLALRKKDAVAAEIDRAQRQGQPFLHVSGMYAPERGGLAVVWPLATHPTNKNELIVWDLAHDPAELLGLGVAQLRERLFTRSDALPEGVTRLPIKTIHLNKSPVVIANLKTLSAERAAHWGIDMAQCLRHAETAASQVRTLGGIWQEVYARPVVEGAPATDVDEDLYGGFLDNEDRRRLVRLRGLTPEQLPAGRAPAFDDPRLDELFWRYRARNFPETLTDPERQRWQAHCAARLLDGEGGAQTVAQFFERIDTLGQAHEEDERAQDILGALYDYAEHITPTRD